MSCFSYKDGTVLKVFFEKYKLVKPVKLKK